MSAVHPYTFAPTDPDTTDYPWDDAHDGEPSRCERCSALMLYMSGLCDSCEEEELPT